MTLALIDERVSSKIEDSLFKRGFYPIRVPKSKRLSEDVSSHPDILMFYDNGVLISSCDYAESAQGLFCEISMMRDGLKMSFTGDIQGDKYPLDCIYNAIRFENKLFLKADTASSALLSYAEEHGLKIVATKQGYPRCTTLKLNESTAISSDDGMLKLLSENGVNAIKIRSGHISLPSREYGFIGGASGVFSDTVYFLGNLDTHPDCELIRKTIRSLGMRDVSLSDEPLFDGGTIIFL